MGSDITRRNLFSAASGTVAASLLAGVAQATSVGGDGSATNASSQRSSNRPNIVLYLPDEMRADALGCYGNAVCKTPNFDALAASGTRFANCHVQLPVCVGSRCALLTGWYPHIRGHRSQYSLVDRDEPNMFRYLKEAGYDVYWFGKNDALVGEAFQDSVTLWGAPEGPHGPPHGKTPRITSMLFGPTGSREEGPDYGFLQLALEALAKRKSDRPFFLFIPGIMPHPPYRAPTEFFSMYDPAMVDRPVPFGAPNKPKFHKDIRSHYRLDALSSRDLRKVRAVYYGMVSYSDWIFGQLVKGVEAAGLSGNTAFFVTSDHGDYAGDYGLVEKWPSGMEDCLTHVPMICRVPGAPAGVVADDMVEMFDLMPTVLELAGTQARHTHFARSFLGQVKGGSGDPNRATFTEGGYNIYEPQAFETVPQHGVYVAKTSLEAEMPEDVSRSVAIRTKDRKLIIRPQGQCELYDCVRDPKLTTNVIGSHRYQKDEAELRARLLNWYINTGVVKAHRNSPDLPPYNPVPELRKNKSEAEILDG